MAATGEIIGKVNIPYKLATTSDLDRLQSDIDYLSNTKQDNLVSGTNIKTINSESILGAGDISITSGTKLYLHTYSPGSSSTGGTLNISFISTDSEPYQYPEGVDNLLLPYSVGGYRQYKDGFYCLTHLGNPYTVSVRKIDMGHGSGSFGYSESTLTWTEETFSDIVTEL